MPSYDERLRNWQRLTDRVEHAAAQNSNNDQENGVTEVTGMAAASIGELMEAMQADLIRESQARDEKFPFFESIFRPIWTDIIEGSKIEQDFLLKAWEYFREKKLTERVDFDISSAVGGEVTAFHFITEEALAEFRVYLGLDPVGGFGAFLDKNFPSPSKQT